MCDDYIVRAGAADSAIRAFAVTSKGIVEEARRRHNTSPVVTAALGRLLTGGVMMGVMMKGEKDLLTIQVKSGGPMRGMTVTADSGGHVKGYPLTADVMLPPNSKGKLDVGGAVGPGIMNVIKDMGMKEPYIGQTVLQTSEIAEDLTYYFATSEQVPSSVGLGVLMNKDNTVKQAGGFIIQLLPFTDEKVIDALEKKNRRDFFCDRSSGAGAHAGEPAGIYSGRFRPGDYRKDSGVFFLQLFPGTGGKGNCQPGEKGFEGNDCRGKARGGKMRFL